MRILLITILFLTGCGMEPRGDFQTSQGWKVFTGGMEINPDTVDTIAEVLLVNLENYDPERFFPARRWVRKREPHIEFVCESPGAWGLTFDWGIRIWWQPCMENSAVAHEMIHWYLRVIEYRDDPAHKEKTLWEDIVYMTNQEAGECN